MRMGKSHFLLLVVICGCAPASATELAPTADRDYQKLRQQAFVSYSAAYSQMRAQRIGRAVSLGKRVFGLEAQGRNVSCAHQILVETKWLLGDTADFRRID